MKTLKQIEILSAQESQSLKGGHCPSQAGGCTPGQSHDNSTNMGAHTSENAGSDKLCDPKSGEVIDWHPWNKGSPVRFGVPTGISCLTSSLGKSKFLF